MNLLSENYNNLCKILSELLSKPKYNKRGCFDDIVLFPFLKGQWNEYLKNFFNSLVPKYNKTAYYDGNLVFPLIKGPWNEYLKKPI